MTSPRVPEPSGQPRRSRHLMDPNAPRPAYNPTAHRKLTRVQQWVMSALIVTTIFHLCVGLIIAANVLDDPAPGARVGLNVIAGAFGVMAAAAALGIHRRPILSPWLLLGLLPMVVGLWITLA